MAWIRTVSLSAGVGGKGLEISGLNISFDIEKSVKGELNTGRFTVYNAKESTRNDILKQGNNIIFKAGYDDEDGALTIFSGTITTSLSYRDGTDYITEIEAVDVGSNNTRFETLTLSLSYASGTDLSTILNDIAGTLNVALTGTENISGIQVKNTFVVADNVNNTIRRIIRILETNDVGMFFDNAEIVLYKKGVAISSFGVVKVTPRSGLIGSIESVMDDSNVDDQLASGENEKQTTARKRFKSILNPKIRPAGTVMLISADTNGAFTVESCKYYGDNFGGDFIVECEVVE